MPKLASRFDRCNLNICPPRDFVAVAMKLSMMFPAQRYGEFVADLVSECPGLCKFQMMRVTRGAPADQARLRGDECEMDLVSPPHRFGQRIDCFGR